MNNPESQTEIPQQENRPQRHILLRFLIAFIWFLPLIMVINMFIGGIVGGLSSPDLPTNATFQQTYQTSFDKGRSSSIEFFNQYGRIIFAIELIIWLALSYTGILPGTGKYKKLKK